MFGCSIIKIEHMFVFGGNTMEQVAVSNQPLTQIPNEVTIANPEYIDDLIVALLNAYANRIEP